MSLFSYVTPATYGLLVILWVIIAAFYSRRRQRVQKDGRSLLSILLAVLMIDAGRTIFESAFFGVWYSARVGFLPREVYDYLVQPEIVFIPKAVNLAAAVVVITIILRRWLPQEEEESRAQRRRAAGLETMVQERTQALSAANAALQEDMKQRAQAEQELRASEARFRDVVEASPSWIWETDDRGVYTFASPRVSSVLGYTPEEVVGRPMSDFAESEDPASVSAVQMSQGRESGELPEHEVWARSKQGGRVCLLRNGTPIRNDAGQIIGLRGVDHDITERKQAEERLRKQKVTFESLFEAIPDAILLTDDERRITAVNQGFTRTFGYSLAEVAGKPTSVFYESEEEFHRQGRLRYSLTASEAAAPYVVTYRHKSGRLLPGETIGTKVVTSDGELLGYFGLIRDISERQLQEQSIRQMQKMQAIGTLSGGIAHDFNNILASIVGYAELLELDVVQGSQSEEYLGEVLTAARRATDLVGRILTFARRGDEARESVALHTVVAETMRLMKRTIPSTITIHERLVPEGDTVLGDVTQLHQVVMNLCTNAAQAMRDQGGTLTVEVTSVTLDAAGVVGLDGLEPGPYVQLRVTDTGRGMSPETVAQVFEPFFTTKPPGEGTGIGMSVVHGIVRGHHGAIAIDSAVGEGTRISVYLPRAGAGVPAPAREEFALAPTQGRVMVVDDEPAIAKVLTTLLKRAGYQARDFTSAGAALEHLREDPTRYDLVITDQTMPTMTGEQFAQALRVVRADLPIIICTGYSEVMTPQRAEALGVRALLTKPVPAATLTRVVSEVLAAQTHSV